MTHASHHPLLFIVLSLVVAVLGSWTALDLFRRVRSHIGRAQRVWLWSAAVGMGISIWSMHFIAMLGFDPGSPVSYDLPLTFLSLALAIGATCGAFFAASRPGTSWVRLLMAGAAMGLGICLMHYVGMAALRTAASLGYRPSFVVASFLIAVAASTAALVAARRDRSLAWRAIAAVILGLAIVGMHYTAMAGLQLTPTAGAADTLPGAPPYVLGVSVAAGTLLILLLALLASLYDQRLNIVSALEAGAVGYWELSLPDMGLEMSARGKEILGVPADAPFGHADLLKTLAAEELPRREEAFARALASNGEYDAEYRLADDRYGSRWVNVRGRVVARSAGRHRRMAGVLLDVTDRRQAFTALAAAERRQRLLIDELNHRVKNTLATVQSIARQTGKAGGSYERLRENFEARLAALSHTHDALTRGKWQSAALSDLVRQELSPYSSNQFEIDGPDVALPPREALAIGMVLHELATNAAKYGALSVTTGLVRATWSHDAAAARLTLEWSESGGPAVTPPQRRGFGSRLLHASIERELGGAAHLAYAEAGFACRLVVPLPASSSAGAQAAFWVMDRTP